MKIALAFQHGVGVGVTVLLMFLLTLSPSQMTPVSAGGVIRNNAGFAEQTLARNDDSSTGAVPIGFNINFFGNTYSTLFVNNNGNVTFASALGTFTPFALTNASGIPIIAPFFADVDTTNPASGVVTYGQDTVNGRKAFGVNWFNVGYFGGHADKLNTFQLVLIDRSDIAPGAFDMEFNYGQIQWETGDASGGSGGFGGSSARAGYSAGTGVPGTFQELPGSAVPGGLLDTNPTTGLVNIPPLQYEVQGGSPFVSNSLNDFYSTTPDTPLVVPTQLGVLSNDPGAVSASLAASTTHGSLNFNADGSFTYTPSGGFTGIDEFTYNVTLSGGATSSAVARISVSPLVIAVPVPETAPQGAPIPIPGISVTSNESDVSVSLSAEHGNLSVTGGVSARKAVPGFAKRLADTSAVSVGGNGSQNLTLSGPVAQVNLVLATLVYQPNASFTGLDQIAVVANSSVQIANARVVVNVTPSAGGAPTPVPQQAAPATANPQLLSVVSQQVGSIVTGQADGSVANGNVFIRIIAAGGTFLSNTSEIGDGNLLALGVTQAVEVFGLTLGGAPVANFTAPARICLLGTGAIYYRDSTQAPRTTVALMATRSGGYSCVQVPNAGTVVMVGGSAAPAASGARIRLEGCMVTTTASDINLRPAPGMDNTPITKLTYNITLTALEREGSWLLLDDLGTQGWANRQFLQPNNPAACGD